MFAATRRDSRRWDHKQGDQTKTPPSVDAVEGVDCRGMLKGWEIRKVRRHCARQYLMGEFGLGPEWGFAGATYKDEHGEEKEDPPRTPEEDLKYVIQMLGINEGAKWQGNFKKKKSGPREPRQRQRKRRSDAGRPRLPVPGKADVDRNS
jgi:hypothetical protein